MSKEVRDQDLKYSNKINNKPNIPLSLEPVIHVRKQTEFIYQAEPEQTVESIKLNNNNNTPISGLKGYTESKLLDAHSSVLFLNENVQGNHKKINFILYNKSKILSQASCIEKLPGEKLKCDDNLNKNKTNSSISTLVLNQFDSHQTSNYNKNISKSTAKLVTFNSCRVLTDNLISNIFESKNNDNKVRLYSFLENINQYSKAMLILNRH